VQAGSLRYRLPAWLAIVAAATSIPTVAISASTAATAAAIATTAAIATAAATIVAAATARTAISPRTRFIHRQISTFEVLAVELLDSCRRFFRRGHLDKAKAARATGHAILDHLGRFNVTCLREMLSQIVAGCLEGEVSYI
jgi:hypothetical protein